MVDRNKQSPAALLKARAKDVVWHFDKLGPYVTELSRAIDRGQEAIGEILEAEADILYERHALFPKRFNEVRAIAKPLTDYFANKTLREFDGRVFLEAGTTPAWLAIALANKKKRDAKKFEFKTVVTNNMAVNAVLCALLPVWQIQGWADTKYFGLFPFNEERNRDFEEDSNSFDRLHREMKRRVDRLILDASNFSFLFGPTVRSWPNVCFKTVAYNVPAPIDIILPGRKVITELGEINHAEVDEEHDTLYSHIKRCYTVFEPSEELFELDNGHGLVPDRDVYANNRLGAGSNFFSENIRNFELNKTWLDLVRKNQGIRVWLGGTRRDLEAIEQHLGLVNQLLRDLRIGLVWEFESNPLPDCGLLGMRASPRVIRPTK